MPIQKGKKRRRQRRHGPRAESQVAAESADPDRRPRASRPVRRFGWEMPLWANAVFGASLALVGIVFFLGQRSGNPTTRVVLLLLYLILAAVYLGKAARQYRARKHT
jgi:hypothetical protein